MTNAYRLVARPILTAGTHVPTQERASRLAAVALVALLLAALPFVHLRVGFVPGFFPTFATLVVVPMLVTSVLLLGQARANRLPAIALLGSGYLFTASVVFVELLAFPGALAPHGLLVAGRGAASWLWTFWHGGYPLFVLGYLLFTLRPARAGRWPDRILWGAPYVAVVLAAIAITTGLHADRWLPDITGLPNAPASDRAIGPIVFELNLAAFAGLAVRRRSNASAFDRWLLVAVLASFIDTSLTLLVESREMLGWYVARINSVVAGSAVLVSLTFEFVRLLGSERSMREQSEIERREAARLRFVAKAGTILSESFELDATLARLVRHVTTTLGPTCTIVVFSGDTVEGVGAASPDRDAAQQLVREIRSSTARSALDRLRVPAFDGAAMIQAGDGKSPHRMFVPVRSHYERVGIVVCERREDGPFVDAEVAMIEEIAARVALAMLNARLYRRERRVADTLQRAMLPSTMPKLAGVVFDAIHQPGNADADVGGDWYDAFELPDGRAMFSIGDVAGRGLAAAIVMGKMRQAIRAFALVEPDPTSIVRNCDRMLRLEGGTMVTAIVGVVDATTATLRFANAGHPGPVVAGARAKPFIVDYPRTTPLGLLGNVEVEAAEIPLVPGQLIVFYTDGLIEAKRDIVASEAQLCATVARLQALVTEHPVEEIREEMIGGAGRDDIAILSISVPSGRYGSLDVQMAATSDNARLLRHAVRRVANEAGLPPDRVFALEVAIGEALANVLEHAYGAGTGDVRVHAAIEHRWLVVEVVDFGRWRSERREGRGHGLNLMRQLSSRFEVIRDDERTRVRLMEPIT